MPVNGRHPLLPKNPLPTHILFMYLFAVITVPLYIYNALYIFKTFLFFHSISLKIYGRSVYSSDIFFCPFHTKTVSWTLSHDDTLTSVHTD